ncbi:MAG: thioredoxin TrxA [Nitrospinota bacterium]
MEGNILHLSDSDFDDKVLQSDIPALVDFWADWCAPCKMIAPTIEELAKEYEGKIVVGKLNVDQNSKTATKYGIRGIPTLLFFKGGKVIQQVVGVKSKTEIQKIIDTNI